MGGRFFSKEAADATTSSSELQEESARDAFLIPTVSFTKLASGDEGETKKLKHMMFNTGFMILSDHGVADDLQDKLWGMYPKFFKSSSANKRVSRTGEDVNGAYGWDDNENLGLGLDLGSKELGTRDMDEKDKTTERQKKDMKECFTIRLGPKTNPYKMTFSPEPKDLPGVSESYIREMERLTKVLLTRMFEVLGSKFVDEGYFDNHMGCLRLNWYMNQDTDADTKPAPGQIRCAEHTDYGPITILKADVVGGLEAYIQNRWIPVQPQNRNDFVINFGDTMMRWSNNKVLATLHRVVNPPKTNKDNTRRSAAWFFNVNGDALISTLNSCVSEKNPDLYKASTMTQMELVLAKHGGSKVVSGRADLPPSERKS